MRQTHVLILDGRRELGAGRVRWLTGAFVGGICGGGGRSEGIEGECCCRYVLVDETGRALWHTTGYGIRDC